MLLALQKKLRNYSKLLISVLSVMYLLSILLPVSHATPYCLVTSKLSSYSLLYFPVHYILLKYSCFYIFFHSVFLNIFPVNSFFLLINRLLPNLFTFFLIFIFPYFLLLTIYHFYVMAQTLLTFLSWEKEANYWNFIITSPLLHLPLLKCYLPFYHHFFHEL